MPTENRSVHSRSFPAPGSTTTTRTVLLGIAFYLVLFGTFHALAQGLPGSFLIDDALRIEPVEPASLDTEVLRRHIEATDMAGFGRPVSLTSLFITKHIYGNSPGAFKHENILLHLLTGTVLFLLVYRLLASPLLHQQFDTERSRTVFALLTATLWLIHPIHVSTVLYAVQRMTILATLFTFLAILFYIIARQAPLQSRTGLFCMVVALPLSIALAILSKDNAALVPIYLLLVEHAIFRWRSDSRAERNSLIASTILFIVAPISLGSAYFLYAHDAYLYDYAVRSFSLLERLATQPVILWQYMAMILLPKLSSMSLYHDAVTIFQPGNALSVIATAGWCLVLFVSLYFLRRHPIPCFGILFFLSSHLIESTFLPLELMFEHRNYLGTAGIMMALVYAFRALSHWLSRGPVVAAISIVLLSGLLYFQTTTRAQVWSNEELLFTVTLSDHPQSGRAGSALANVHLEQGQFDRARQTLIDSIAHASDRSRTGLRLHLFGTYCLGDRPPPDQLYSSLLQDLGTEPISAYVLSGLRTITHLRSKDSCAQFPTEDILALYATAAENPRGRRRTLFYASFMAAEAFLYEERFEQSVQFYERALKYASNVPRPNQIQALIGLADGLIELNQPERAEAVIQRAQDLIEQSIISYPDLQPRLDNQRTVIRAMEKTFDP